MAAYKFEASSLSGLNGLRHDTDRVTIKDQHSNNVCEENLNKRKFSSLTLREWK